MLCAIPVVREVVPTDVNIVRLVVEEGKSLNEVAAHLGIARSLLQRWKEQLARDGYNCHPGVWLWVRTARARHAARR
jgi:transposase